MLRKRRDSDNLIVGLDAGSTKICVVVAEENQDGLNILSANLHQSRGIRKGSVISVDEAARSIKNAIADAERQAGVKIEEVYTSITGSHIKNICAQGASSIGAKGVRPEDVEMAVNSAADFCMPLDREILHILPADFIVDGRAGIIDPAGLYGSRLEAKVNIVTCDALLLRNLINCIEMAELRVAGVIFQPFASAESVLRADEMDEGVAIIDIGGGITDIAVYKNGLLNHLSVISIGGGHFTNDVAVGTEMTFHEAEVLKKKYGLMIPKSQDAVSVNASGIDAQKKGVHKIDASGIMRMRAEELLNLISEELQAVQVHKDDLSGVVITGGSSLLSGFDIMAEEILSLPVRVGYPDDKLKNMTGFNKSYGLKGELNDPSYATCMGLILSGTGQMVQTGAKLEFFSSFVSKTSGWFKNILKRDQPL